jgi:AraC-like DNA-binding protein
MVQTLPLRIFESKLVTLAPYWQAKNRRNSFWRLYFNHTPGATIRSQGMVYSLYPQRLFLVPAGVAFDCTVEPQNGVYPLHFYIHFDIAGFCGLRLREAFNALQPLPSQPRLEETAREICGILKPVDPMEGVEIDLSLSFKLQYLLLGVLALAWDSLAPEKQKHGEFFSERYEAIAPALLFIEEHMELPMNNDELASYCCLSRHHFIRCFKAATSHSPQQYILERRIALASQQLLFSDAPIEKIAADCGFANRFYFTRMFTKTMEIPPAAFRRDGFRM